MRKYIKQQIISIVYTIKEAHMEVNKFIEQGEDINNLLTDIQAGAIQIGETIEKFEGQQTDIIKDLEEYCELLWECSQSADLAIIKSTFNKLVALFENIEKKIENDIKEEYIIAYLPYKASMWDSMESIWIEANKDSRIKNYVIPIPYYDRNSDMTLGEFHYEGNQFDKSVDIYDWRYVNLERIHPEAIIIHNPYDDNNRVTSIHPNYYSKIIKKYCEMLVYVPYYVSIADTSINLCTNTTSSNADKIYVSSDRINDIYKEANKRIRGERLDKKEFRKIVTVGSPQVDKVNYYLENQDKIKYPDKWEKFIFDENGKKRGIVLYNSSLAELLNNPKKYLNDMSRLFHIFKDISDLGLLWRPHPLLKSTFKSMLPQLYRVYIELEKMYINEEIGIYDDSPDLYRAIMLSDAYYGSKSSALLPLFGLTGKPILMSDNELTEEFTKSNIKTFEDNMVIFRDEKLYNPLLFRIPEYDKDTIGKFLELVKMHQISEKQKEVFSDIFYKDISGKSAGKLIVEDILKSLELGRGVFCDD